MGNQWVCSGWGQVDEAGQGRRCRERGEIGQRRLALFLPPLSFKPKSKPRHHRTTKSTDEVICIDSSGDETDDVVLHQQQITASDADHDPESVYLGECVVLDVVISSFTAVYGNA
eukprot:scaffold2192_cov200-Alexandrium_tamarense.AAC.10